MPSPLQFLVGFAGNLLITLTIVRGLYFPGAPRRRQQAFTLITFSSLVFLLVIVLLSVELGIGTAFGLFALFSILRFRSEPMSTRDLTYFFILIGLSLINAAPLMSIGFDWLTVLTGNVVIVVLLFILEQGWGFNSPKRKRKPKRLSQKVVYPRDDLLRPENKEQLIAKMHAETGLQVVEVEVGKIDMVNDVAELTLFYPAPANEKSAPIDNST